MKKEYIKPNMLTIELDNEDSVLTTSYIPPHTRKIKVVDDEYDEADEDEEVL